MFGTKIKEQQLKRFMVMCKSKTGTTFYHEKSFFTLADADAYANLVRRQKMNKEITSICLSKANTMGMVKIKNE